MREACLLLSYCLHQSYQGPCFCAVTFGSVCLVLRALKKAKKENSVAQLTLNAYEKLFTFGLAPKDDSLLRNVAIEDSKSIP